MRRAHDVLGVLRARAQALLERRGRRRQNEHAHDVVLHLLRQLLSALPVDVEEDVAGRSAMAASTGARGVP